MSHSNSVKYSISFLIALTIFLGSASNSFHIHDNQVHFETLSAGKPIDPLREMDQVSPAAPQYKIQSYINRNPIYISGNLDFASQASSEGWIGNGSISAPYIIENYHITNSSK